MLTINGRHRHIRLIRPLLPTPPGKRQAYVFKADREVLLVLLEAHGGSEGRPNSSQPTQTAGQLQKAGQIIN